MSESCCCCGHRIVTPEHDAWQGRMDDYCVPCRWTRCDAYPGECSRDFWGSDR